MRVLKYITEKDHYSCDINILDTMHKQSVVKYEHIN